MLKPAPFVVPDELRKTLENLPPVQASRSKLEPFRTFILRWRREGRSYRDILEILATECKVTVTFETLRRFVKLRSKPRKQKPVSEIEELIPEPAQPPLPEQPATPRTAANLSPGATQQRVSLASFRNKPALPPKLPLLVEFHYDEDKPLTIDRTIKD